MTVMTGHRPGSLDEPGLTAAVRRPETGRSWRQIGVTVRRWAYRIALFATIVVAGAAYGVPFWYHLHGQQILVVTSGSMHPTVEPGDAVIVQGINPTQLRTGMVVTFWSSGENGKKRVLTTHRIVELLTLPLQDQATSKPLVSPATGEPLLGRFIRTKGDDNATPDPDMVRIENVRGVVVDTKRDWGRWLLQAHSPGGRLFIFAPALLLLLAAEILSWRRDRRGEPVATPLARSLG